MGIETAMVASTVISAGSQYMAGEEEADANSEAGETSFLMALEAMTFQDEALGEIEALQEPWRIAGENALEALQNAPDFEFTPETFEFMADPSYEWRVDEGISALDASAASDGRVLSGAQDKALMEYGQNMASQEYQSAWERWMAEQQFDYNTQVGEYAINQGADQFLASSGQSATNVLSQAYTNTADDKANYLLGGTSAYNTGQISSAEATSDAMTGTATAINTSLDNYLIQDSYLNKF